MLGPVDAAADKDAPVAIEHRGADAGAVRQGFETRHVVPTGCYGARELPSIVGVSATEASGAAGGERPSDPRKHRGGRQAAPSLDVDRLSYFGTAGFGRPGHSGVSLARAPRAKPR